MAEREWIEMPVVGNGVGDDPARPKYPIEASAVLVYRGAKVYVAFQDKEVHNEAVKQPDVRLLTPNEARELEESTPFPIASPTSHHDHSHEGPLRLGDAVSWLTHKLGVEECTGCKKRRRGLNRVVIWGWWKR